jgi:hypothetical protein
MVELDTRTDTWGAAVLMVARHPTATTIMATRCGRSRTTRDGISATVLLSVCWNLQGKRGGLRKTNAR